MSDGEDITVVPLHLGVRFSPPALVYVYQKKSRGTFTSSILRRRIMPIRDFFQSSDVLSAAEKLRERHGRALLENVPLKTICKMLRLLREHRNGLDLKTALDIVEEEANELEGINEMLKKTDVEYKKAVNRPMENTFVASSNFSNSTLRQEERNELKDLDVETTWNDDDEDSLELPADKTDYNISRATFDTTEF